MVLLKDVYFEKYHQIIKTLEILPSIQRVERYSALKYMYPVALKGQNMSILTTLY